MTLFNVNDKSAHKRGSGAAAQRQFTTDRPQRRQHEARSMPWSRTNGINTNGVAAKVMILDRLGIKVRYFDRF